MNFEVEASARSDMGKGASRRLRRDANKIPAVIYGGNDAPQSIELVHDHILHALENEAFYSHILTITVDGKSQKAILKDLQRHPYKPKILHADFLRVSKDHAIRVHVPLHFMGEDIAVGVKEQGGVISHLQNQVEIECLPDNLPEYIEVDISKLELDESIHLSQITLPKNTKLVDLMGNQPHDKAIVSIHMPKKIEEPEPAETLEAAEAEGEAEAGESDAAEGREGAADAADADKKD